MLTVALWDLGQDGRPASVQVPRILRRVGADVVAVVRHAGSTPATVARQAGYRHRSCLSLADDVPVTILSRLPLSDAGVSGHWPVSRATVRIHTPSAVLPFTVTDLSEAPAPEAARSLEEAAAGGAPCVITGNLGHDLGNPRGAWLPVRRYLLDPGQVSGGVPAGPRLHGFLSLGVEPRGAGTLRNAGGGGTDLVWVRLAA